MSSKICEYAMVISFYTFICFSVFPSTPIFTGRRRDGKKNVHMRICIVFAMQNLAIYRYTMGLNSNMNPIERGCAGIHILVVYAEFFFYLISQCYDVWCYVYTLKGKYKRIYGVLRRYRYFKKLL